MSPLTLWSNVNKQVRSAWCLPPHSSLFAVCMHAPYYEQPILIIPGNNPPTLTGDDVFHVNVGEENIYTFTVNDTDDFNVTIEGGAPKDGVLTDDGDGEYTFTWTPGVIPNISGLSLVATDSSGAATLHSPSVQVCACFNGGECTEEGVMNINELYLILTCLCDDGKL